ncbi:MAG: hypothetical protein JWO36_5802 [Myxococcales bacterium]|nr:hypothetical protein [Myxococcales bacterium]
MPVAALVIGIVGLVLSLVPCLGMYALPLTILGVVLGALGMKKVPGKGMAIAGMVCGLVGTLIATWWLYAYLTTKNLVDTEVAKHKAEIEKELKNLGSNHAGSDQAGSDQPDVPEHPGSGTTKPAK